QPMRSISELMLVRGMTKELYAALQPYVAVLPVGISSGTPTSPASTGTATSININTAPEPVLLSLAPNVNRAAVEKFMAVRKTQPFTSNNAATTGEYAFIPPANGGASASQVTMGVNSSYFELQAEVSIGSGRLALYSVMYRPGNSAPVVLAHSTNTE
ncbi:MAG: type II secretion system protein GspK, partial [Nevskia sp.]|nr:type II secretion system protein GspK [Nevskia sp.]